MECGHGLAPAGIWNFLWRLGIPPHDCTIESLPAPGEAVLWASLSGGESAEVTARLRAWIGAGGYLVASGDACAWAAIFDWDAERWSSCLVENPFAGLASILPGHSASLLAPQRWGYSAYRNSAELEGAVGTLVTVQGERQTPGRAALLPLDAPALVLGRQYCFLNGHPFAALQAWLQGQDDLLPWLNWRHRMFWLDEWVSSLADALVGLPALDARIPRRGIPGLGATTVVLRHDLDHSVDTSYLDEEVKRGLIATHGVLRDANRRFWQETLGAHPGHESALHYNTGRRRWLTAVRARLSGASAVSVAADRAAVSADGLLRQVRWARGQGIGTATLLRHLSFLVYPEWVDGLDHVFETEAGVRGGSSLFRAQVLRWGAEGVDGMAGTLGEWPDPQFPLWLPFKVAHAAFGRRLRGWESTSVMESEPELIDHLLSHRIAHLPQRVLTLGYHPAHARGTTFNRDGSLAMFRRVLDVVKDRGAEVTTLRDVFARADAAVAGA